MTTNLLSVIEQQQKALEEWERVDVLGREPHIHRDSWKQFVQDRNTKHTAALAAGQQALEQAQGEPERSLYEMLQMCVDENKQLRAQLAGMERLLHFKAAIEADPPANDPAQSSNQPAQHSESRLLDSEPAPLSHLKTETGAPPEQGAITPGNGSEPAPSTAGEAAPKAAMFHDAGAIAQCGYCQRYTLDRKALSDRQPVCTCGEKYGWSGSFKPPGADAHWHGPAPAAQPSQGERAHAAINLHDAWLYFTGAEPSLSRLGQAIDHAAALLQSTADHIPDAGKMGAAMPVGELTDEQDMRDAQEAPFEAWWESMGQYGRAGGGGYEKTFAWNAWCAAARSQTTTEESSVVAGAQPVREPLTDDTKRLDALEASNVGQNMWIVARGKDSFTVALKSPYGNCVTRRTLREAIDAGIEAAHGITKKGAPGAAKEQTP